MYAGIAFSSFDRALAAQLIRYANELSYRDLCLLALVARKGELELPTEEEFDQRKKLPWEEWGARRDLAQIGWGERELVIPETDQGEAEARPQPVIPFIFQSPSRQALSGLGKLLYNLMDLDRIPLPELQVLAATLRGNLTT